MKFSSWLNSTRFAVGFLFVVLAAKFCTLAVAQDDVEQAQDVSVRLPESLDQQRSTMPPITESQDDGADGWYQPFCNDDLGGCSLLCCENPCPCVYGQIEALFLMRHPRFNRQPIIVDPNTNTRFLSTSNLDFNVDPGVRATIGTRLPGDWAMEFTYFGLFQGDASAAVVAPNAAAFLAFPNNLAGNAFVDMDSAQVNYSSWLNSFELNFSCCCGCCEELCCCEVQDQCGCGGPRQEYGSGVFQSQSFTWFGGFRYFNLGEKLDLSSQRTVAGAVEQGSYNIRTTNNLYGAQLGARMRQTQGRFGWEATGKAGVYGNDADQEQTVTDFPPGGPAPFQLRNASSGQGGVAFIGEGNLTALYRLTNVWNIRAGYNVIWIEGLALAPDQLDFNLAAAQGGRRLDNDGGLFLHGVNVGLEARW